MRIALAQLNFHIGDIEYNSGKIIETIARAKSSGADLVVFSELSVCGYSPLDQLEYPHFIHRCREAVENIAKACTGIAAVAGFPSVNTGPTGKNLRNTACLLGEGKILSLHFKATLPDYDVFDEYRYFEPTPEYKPAVYKGIKMAMPICEDVWNEHSAPFPERVRKNDNVRTYSTRPVDEWIKLSPDIILNISASPFSAGHAEERIENLGKVARYFGAPLFYTNQVGANAELVFDGGSLVMNADGSCCDELEYFSEDLRLYDLSDIKNPKKIQLVSPGKRDSKIARIHDALVLGIRDYFLKNNVKKALLGLSGGIDSAVVLELAVKALGKENVKAILLPSRYSSEHSVKDAIELAENCGCEYEKISIEDAFRSLGNMLAPYFKGLPENVTEENIQSRLRAVILMAFSNKFGYMLLNTSNKSEMATGYGTLYGDMCGSLSVLGDVYKTQVYEMAEFINREKRIIPKNILTKAPSAELRPGQKDSDSLPEYDLLDKILYLFIEEKQGSEEIIARGFDKALVEKILRLLGNSEFKRHQSPPTLRVSSKAFGSRIMPVVGRFDP